MITVCKIKSTKPSVVGKAYTLQSDGLLRRETFGSIFEGTMQRLYVKTPKAFCELIEKLEHSECLTYGVPPKDAGLVTRKDWEQLQKPSDPLPRTDDTFAYLEAPAVLMFDYDAPKDGKTPLDQDGVLNVIYDIAPALRDSQLVWVPSSSSFIYHEEKQMLGLRGQRVYCFVNNGSDIPRIAKVVPERLWAKGYGFIEVSKSGSLLERTPFDASVWRPSRIDFAAGAFCGAGLEQRRGLPRLIGPLDGAPFVNSSKTFPDLSPEETAKATANKSQAKQSKQVEALEIRATWIAQRTTEIASRSPKLDNDAAIKVVERAIEYRDLSSDWPLVIQEDVGTERVVTVGQVLSNPKKYNGMLTKDPLEPDYDGGRWVGKLFLDSASPNLFSFAHGGSNFKLRNQLIRIEYCPGNGRQATDDCLEVLRRSKDLFDFGEQLVLVGPCGLMSPLDEHTLRYEVGGRIQFFIKKRNRNGSVIEALVDPPDKVIKNIIALKTRRNLNPLAAVLSAPTLRPDGSVLQTQGYDPSTNLYIEYNSAQRLVIENPTREEATHALRVLWKPFREFPFCRPIDRGVCLAGLITAAVRSGLPAAPAVAYDAPIQGSGKTLMARCTGALADGEEPKLFPHVSTRSDEEVRKRIFAALLMGAKSMIWDNIVGSFDSVSMAALLTSPTFTDRQLGQSKSLTLPNRMMVLLTGNNLTLQGEMPRRVLVCRIDPNTERPFGRSFEVDPYDYCLRFRIDMIIAALTLIRAALTHGTKTEVKGTLASFEHWDRWVRRAVIFANELGEGEYADPMEAINLSQAADPEKEALETFLVAFQNLFTEAPISAQEILEKSGPDYLDANHLELRVALESFTGRRVKDLNAKTLGKLLAYRADRIVEGRKLVRGPKVNDRQTWRVVNA